MWDRQGGVKYFSSEWCRQIGVTYCKENGQEPSQIGGGRGRKIDSAQATNTLPEERSQPPVAVSSSAETNSVKVQGTHLGVAVVWKTSKKVSRILDIEIGEGKQGNFSAHEGNQPSIPIGDFNSVVEYLHKLDLDSGSLTSAKKILERIWMEKQDALTGQEQTFTIGNVNLKVNTRTGKSSFWNSGLRSVTSFDELRALPSFLRGRLGANCPKWFDAISSSIFSGKPVHPSRLRDTISTDQETLDRLGREAGQNLPDSGLVPRLDRFGNPTNDFSPLLVLMVGLRVLEMRLTPSAENGELTANGIYAKYNIPTKRGEGIIEKLAPQFPNEVVSLRTDQNRVLPHYTVAFQERVVAERQRIEALKSPETNEFSIMDLAKELGMHVRTLQGRLEKLEAVHGPLGNSRLDRSGRERTYYNRTRIENLLNPPPARN